MAVPHMLHCNVAAGRASLLDDVEMTGCWTLLRRTVCYGGAKPTARKQSKFLGTSWLSFREWHDSK
jgi:hypothetical protein